MSDYAIYLAHAAFWGAFGVTRLIVSRGAAPAASTSSSAAPTAPPADTKTAPFSRGLLAFHMVAFGVMYFGVFNAVFGVGVLELFPFQRVAGAAVMAIGSFMMCWSLVYFRSWRFRAQLDSRHELASGGPFTIVRHPIYVGLNLLAVGTALWMPSVFTAVGAVLMIIGSDLRGRAEERLLVLQFGDRYGSYMQKTKRFLPGIY